MSSKIFFHADDYGITESQAAIIYDCFQNGCLNSISIMTNSPKLETSYHMIEKEIKEHKIRCVIHLNFVEGYSCAPANEIPDLLKKDGKLGCTFGSILKANFSAKRKLYKLELKKEIAAQMKAVSKLLGTKHISVDSHQHFHMIPVVWEALMEVVKENGYTLEYVRVPQDPISPILSSPKLWKKVKLINIVKWIVLKVFAPPRRVMEETGAEIPVFFGMFFTCRMEKNVVEVLLPKYKKIANKKQRDLELMFHPGAIYHEEQLLDKTIRALKAFYSAEERKKEECALKSLHAESYK